jgi:anaerobic carbon-monoxide dehydrogenase iron sulfur subunit
VIVRSERCRNCQVCILACSLYHEGECRPSAARLHVVENMADHTFGLTVCRHCPAPACLEACLSGAMSKESGVVRIDPEACELCGACAAACPEGAIFYHAALGRYLKCDLCLGREGGPLCAALCPVGALLSATEGEA